MNSKIQIRIGMWSSIMLMILFAVISFHDVFTLLLITGIFGGFALSVKFRGLKMALIIWFFIGFLTIDGAWSRYAIDLNLQKFVLSCVLNLIILFLFAISIRGIYKEQKYINANRISGLIGVISGIVFYISSENSLSSSLNDTIITSSMSNDIFKVL